MENYEKFATVGLIALFFGMAVVQVGQVLPPSNEPVSWVMPFAILMMMGAPAILMYIAGRKDGRGQ